jgi:hypothetical protein
MAGNTTDAPISVSSSERKVLPYGTDFDRLRQLKAEFLDDYAAESTWRDQKKEYGRFYDGDQLTEEEKRELQARGQPPVVINRVKPKVDAILGIIQELGVEVKAFPFGDREKEATEISERFRQIENNSHFNEEETQVFKDVLIDGVGYFETKREFDGVDSRLITEHLPNKFVTWDKYSRRADGKDAKRIHKHVWKDLGDTKALFPGHDDMLDVAVTNPDLWSKMLADQLSQYRPDQYQQQGGSRGVYELAMQNFADFVDQSRKMLRVITTFYRTIKVRRFLTANGQTEEVTGLSDSEVAKIRGNFDGATEWTQTDKVLNSCTFCWGGVLEEKKNIRPFDRTGKFTIERAPGYMLRDGERNIFYGIVKQHLDPQREVNKRRSKCLHQLNTNQVWFEDGAFPEESVAKLETGRPDGWVKYRKDFKVDRITHEQLAQSQFQLLQEAKAEIDSSGVNREIEGQSKAQSGREFQLRLKEGLKSIRELVANMRACRRRVAEYWLDEILWDAKKEAEAQGADFSMTKYDVTIEEAPESANLQSETFETLAQLSLKGLPIPPQVLIQVSPLAPKYKDMIMQSWGAGGGAPGQPPGAGAPAGPGQGMPGMPGATAGG